MLGALRRALDAANAARDLLELQDTTTAALEAMRAEIAALRERMAALENEQRLAAQQAAAAAATAIVAGSIADMSRRIGHLEAGQGPPLLGRDATRGAARRGGGDEPGPKKP